MKLNTQYPDKKFTIRVKNLTDNIEFLIERKVYIDSKNQYCINYNGDYHKLILTVYAPYVGTIIIPH